MAAAARRCGGARGRGPGGGAGRRAGGARTPTSCWSARTSCPSRPTRRPTRSCARSARRRRSRRSCTTAYPVRFWDHDLGPDVAALVRRGLGTDVVAPLAGATDPRLDAHRPDAGRAAGPGRAGGRRQPGRPTVVTGWNGRPSAGRSGRRWSRSTWRRASAGCSSTIPTRSYESPAISPDGALGRVRPRDACRRRTTPGDRRSQLVALAGGEPRTLVRELGPLAAAARSGRPTARGLLVIGRRRRSRAGVPGRPRVRRGHAADHRRLRLLRRAVEPRRADASTRCGRRTTRRRDPVRIDAGHGRREPTPLRSPAATPELPGTLTEVETTAEDGARVRAWLALPEDASATTRRRCCSGSTAARSARGTRGRGGGTRGSLVARGYAVLLPDPALSTGYGLDFIQPRLGRVGRGAVHRPAGDHRRGGRARRHRRDAHGRDGRLVRRLHGQLGGRAHRPVPGDRHARQPVGARPVRADDRRGLLLGARDDPGDGAGQLAAPVRRRRSSPRCSSSTATRTTGCPSARGCASGRELAEAAPRPRTARCRTGSCTSPTRTTGCSRPQHAKRLVPGGRGVPGGARARPDG